MAKEEKGVVVSNPLLQMAPISATKSWYKDFVKFSQDIMKKDMDYGIIPGTGTKPSLLKPGAEKLRFVYGLGTEETMTDKTIDIDKGFVSYSYKVSVKNKEGIILAECEGNCNSFEPKFRYLWVQESALPAGTDKSKLQSRTSKITEFDFAISKAETTGQYGKPAEYWQKWQDAIRNGTAKQTTRDTQKGKSMKAWEMGGSQFRVQNPDIMGMTNTIMKMAQKRAFVGAMLLATGASEFYTQDIEDMTDGTSVPEVIAEPSPITQPVSSKAEEGEVVAEPAPQQAPDEAHHKRVEWIKGLIAAGKIKMNRDPESLTSKQSIMVMDNYKKSIGK